MYSTKRQRRGEQKESVGLCLLHAKGQARSIVARVHLSHPSSAKSAERACLFDQKSNLWNGAVPIDSSTLLRFDPPDLLSGSSGQEPRLTPRQEIRRLKLLHRYPLARCGMPNYLGITGAKGCENPSISEPVVQF